VDSFAPAAAPRAFRAADRLVGVLTVLFVLNAVVDGIFVCLELAIATVDVTQLGTIDLGDDTELYVFYAVYGVLALGRLGVFVLTSILFLVWINRANKNARALGAQGMEFTSGWCVGWWFVPIMNLFKPYQAVCEIFRSSSPTATATSWKPHPVPGYFGWWWGLWLIGNFLGQLEFRLGNNDDPDMLTASAVVGVVGGIVGVAGAFAAMMVVRTINRRQTEKAGRTQKPGSTFSV